MIVATEDNTVVDVYYPSGASLTDEQVTLNQYQVYTKDLYEATGKPKTDLTGTRVVANKPVAVYSGVGRALLKASEVRNKAKEQVGMLPTGSRLLYCRHVKHFYRFSVASKKRNQTFLSYCFICKYLFICTADYTLVIIRSGTNVCARKGVSSRRSVPRTFRPGKTIFD